MLGMILYIMRVLLSVNKKIKQINDLLPAGAGAASLLFFGTCGFYSVFFSPLALSR
jgi:hypothetical protein